MNFPFGSYKQVFVEPEMAVSALSLGASMSIFSSQILFDGRIIDQVCLFLNLTLYWICKEIFVKIAFTVLVVLWTK